MLKRNQGSQLKSQLSENLGIICEAHLCFWKPSWLLFSFLIVFKALAGNRSQKGLELELYRNVRDIGASDNLRKTILHREVTRRGLGVGLEWGRYILSSVKRRKSFKHRLSTGYWAWVSGWLLKKHWIMKSRLQIRGHLWLDGLKERSIAGVWSTER